MQMIQGYHPARVYGTQTTYRRPTCQTIHASSFTGAQVASKQTFSAQVDAIIADVEERIDTLIRMSVQDVIDIAQEPGLSKATTEKAIKKGLGSRLIKGVRMNRQGPIANPSRGGKGGGKMPVDTGFLRASGQVSLSGMPQGPTRGEKDQSYEYDANQTEVTLAGVKAGDRIWFGWTAAYAAKMELYYGFLASAVQRWNEIVERNTNRIRRDFE